jgi:hypothetical protein
MLEINMTKAAVTFAQISIPADVDDWIDSLLEEALSDKDLLPQAAIDQKKHDAKQFR